MSLDDGLARLLERMRGALCFFVIESRAVNADFAKTTLSALAGDGVRFTVVDTDAFYASGSELARGAAPRLTSAQLLLPLPGEPAETVLSSFVDAAAVGGVLLDNVNTLFHMTAEGSGSASRKVDLAMACASYLARTRGSIAACILYGRGKGPVRRSTSMANMADVVYRVSRDGGMLVFEPAPTEGPAETIRLPVT
jgi:hypothetical protein